MYLILKYLYKSFTGGTSDKSTWRCEGPGCKGEKKGCKIQVFTDTMKLVYPHTENMHKCKEHVNAKKANQKPDHEEEAFDKGLIPGMFD